MRYVAELSGIKDAVHCSGLMRATDLVRGHVLKAYPNCEASGRVYTVNDEGLRTLSYQWGTDENGFTNEVLSCYPN